MRYELTEQAIKDGKEVFKNMRKTCLKCNEDFAFFCQNAVIHDRRGHDRNIANHTRHAHYWGEIIDSVVYQTEFNIDENLTHFQALYILLGWQVNVERLSNQEIKNYNIYQNLQRLYLTKYDPDQKHIQSSVNVKVMDILLGSEASDKLNLKFDDEDRSIKKDEFLAWAVDKGFLIKQGARVLDDNIAKQLHTLLTDNGFITDSFNNKWQWRGQRNQLAYLAKQLKQKRLLNDNCHSELLMYIVETNESNRPLKNAPDPAIKSQEPINNIINELT
jgi:hypothetical protein